MTLATVLTLGLLPLGQIGPLTHLGTLTENLESPARLAITTNGVMVTDPRANRLVRFDDAGALVGAWSEPAGPLGVAVHPDGRIFVSRRDDAKVGVYDSTFTLLRFLGDGLPMVNFVKPTDMAVDAATGRIYVVDSGGDRVYGFESDESLAVMFGIRGEHSSEFKCPSAIAVDSANNRLWVADQDNYRVQVFDTSGLFLFQFGYRIKYLPGGLSEGWFARPAGLAVDAQGYVYVTDALMSTLRVFDGMGSELDKVVDYGFAPGDLRTPCDVAIDGAGRILVANSSVGGVEIYAAPSPRRRAATVGKSFPGTNASGHDLMLRATRRSAALLGWGGARAGAGTRDLVGYEPPHVLDDALCERCHGVDGQPGGHLGLVEGQTNLCFSCHTSGGQALATLIRPTENLGTSHAWGVSAVNASVGSVGPAPGGEMELYLDGGNIKCATCHNQHNNDAGSPYLRGPADALCQECHADHVIHTPSGPWQPGCTDCHAAHDPDDRNLSLVAGSVYNQTLGVDKPVTFTARTGSNSFADGDPAAFDGICEICHTATAYHRHDGTGAPHNAGLECVSCHPHDAGFMPTGGGCTGCHSSAQDNGDGIPTGGRRAVVGEFGWASHHLQGASLDDTDCVVCHEMTQHQQGSVRLFNVDDPTNPAAVITLTGDPAVDPTEAAKLEAFCLACHDDNGAGGAVPFSDGIVPAPIDASLWSSASHNLGGGAGSMTCFGDGETFGCHSTGHGSAKGKLLAPADASQPPVSGDPLREQEGMCYTCHDADGPASTDVQAQFSLATHHNVSSLEQGDGSKVECTNCHNPHAASSAAMLADPDSGGVWAGDGVDFCLTCHDGAPPASVSFPATPSGTGYDKSAYVASTHGAHLGSNSCRLCHEQHGSAFLSLLKDQYVVADYNPYTAGDGDYAACWICHDENAVIEQGNAFKDRHRKHVKNADAPCFICHDAHAPFDTGEEGLINFEPGIQHGYDIEHIDGNDASTSFWIDSGQDRGYCYIRCHGHNHQPRWYDRINVSTVNCSACHGAPPASGAHPAHFGGDAGLAAYGGTDNLSTPSAYVFACGTCHPLSPTTHMNDTVEVELYHADAPAGSLKSMNPPTATYTPGDTPYTDSNGIPYTLGTCANVYCHGKTDWSSPDPISAPIGVDSNGNLTYEPYTVTEFKVYASVNWGDPPLGCNGCHRNNPQTSWPNVQAGVGNSHGWIDDFGYEDLHAWNMASDPLTCRVCHYGTVTDEMTWTRDAWDVTYFDDVAIADKSYHVNAAKDVVFDPVNPVQVRSSTFSLVGMTYDPAARLCSSTPCHLNQTTPQWGKPYRWWNSTECNQCHQLRGSGAPPPGDEHRGDRAATNLIQDSKCPGGECLDCHEGHGRTRHRAPKRGRPGAAGRADSRRVVCKRLWLRIPMPGNLSDLHSRY